MREIKFRAIRVDNGEWVYGSLLVLNSGFYIVDTDYYNSIIADLHEKLKINALWEDNDFKRVSENTICQFTGLCDKNGKEIYEGDIVHCWDTIAKCEIWAVVEFGNPNAEYTWGWQLRKIKGSKGVNPDILCWLECEETNAYCEIIGNIYDNPELLKGE